MQWLLTMKRYRVLTEWLTLAKIYVAGEEVELPESEAAPFLGKALEAIADNAPAEPDAEPVKRKKST